MTVNTRTSPSEIKLKKLQTLRDNRDSEKNSASIASYSCRSWVMVGEDDRGQHCQFNNNVIEMRCSTEAKRPKVERTTLISGMGFG